MFALCVFQLFLQVYHEEKVSDRGRAEKRFKQNIYTLHTEDQQFHQYQQNYQLPLTSNQ